MKATMIIAGLILTTATCFAELDYKQLAQTKADQPTTVAILETVQVSTEFGNLQIPKGSEVKLLSVGPDGNLTAQFVGNQFTIPANKTDIEKRVAEIRRRRLIVSDVTRTDLVTANPATPQIGIKSVSDIVNRMPNDLFPSRDQQFWNDLLLKQANQWLSDNIVGQRMQVTAQFGSPEPQGETIKVYFWLSGIVAKNLKLNQLQFVGTFSGDQANVIAKKVNGTLCTFVGTISSMVFRNVGFKDGKDPTIPTEIAIGLVDCKLSQDAAQMLLNSQTKPRDPNFRRLGEPLPR